MAVTELETTIDTWINALHHYDLDVLQTKPNKNSWSLGQVYIHILNDTNYYIEQIESCLSHRENQFEEMTGFAAKLFLNNGFPDEKIEGDPVASQAIRQPTDKVDLTEQMTQLKARLLLLCMKVAKSNSIGKTKHPGLGYFNAREWLKFSEMHMRHHLRQKGRIEDAFLLR